jgi:peptide/nickel transport system permease protein
VALLGVAHEPDRTMIVFTVSRLIHAAAVLFGVVSATFLILHVAGDPLAGLIPPGAAPEIEAQIRHAYGLDRPLPVQFVDFVGGAMRGDFGESWRQERPAMSAVLERLPVTLVLTLAAIALAVLVAVMLGLVSAANPGSPWDVLARSIALLGQAVPAFWLGTMLILVFAIDFNWLPSSGIEEPIGYVLPALALGAYPAATLTRLLRASLLEVLDADYIRTARAKGLRDTPLLLGHALRNAALPALAYTGLQIGFLLGGAVIVEGVFALPGIGSLALEAVLTRDLPLVQAFVWTVAALILAVNFIVALLARMLDPRLRYETNFSRGLG